jgi:hypothetical protein
MPHHATSPRPPPSPRHRRAIPASDRAQRDLPGCGTDLRPEVKGVVRAGRGDFWLQSMLKRIDDKSCTMTMISCDNFCGDIPKVRCRPLAIAAAVG